MKGLNLIFGSNIVVLLVNCAPAHEGASSEATNSMQARAEYHCCKGPSQVNDAHPQAAFCESFRPDGHVVSPNFEGIFVCGSAEDQAAYLEHSGGIPPGGVIR